MIKVPVSSGVSSTFVSDRWVTLVLNYDDEGLCEVMSNYCLLFLSGPKNEGLQRVRGWSRSVTVSVVRWWTLPLDPLSPKSSLQIRYLFSYLDFRLSRFHRCSHFTRVTTLDSSFSLLFTLQIPSSFLHCIPVTLCSCTWIISLFYSD